MNEPSKIFGMSVRAFIAMIVTFTLCGMSVFGITVVEPFYSVSVFVIGFYFGQKSNPSLASGGNGAGK